MVVGGPGVVHAMAGIVNSSVNCTPLLVLAGSVELDQVYKGAFQELDQISLLSPLVKFAGRPTSLQLFPEILSKAYRNTIFGRPGPSYVDLPADVIRSTPTDDEVSNLSLAKLRSDIMAPKSAADPDSITKVVSLLQNARFPLIIVGKGAAYAHAESELQELVSQTNVAFLPTPMGKGVIPDEWDDTNVSSARSDALKTADVIILFGARLNWILHFGDPPRYHPKAKIIQIDIQAEEIGNNTGDASLGILGDLKLVTTQLSHELKSINWKAPQLPSKIIQKKSVNSSKALSKETSFKTPMSYQSVYKVIKDCLAKSRFKPDEIIYVSEGANTMDIARVSFPVSHPRKKLDAGTNATMGVGLGYAIAAQAAEPTNLILAIEGDSAVGFSLIEIETAVRNNLPLIIVVMNNSGIYHGSDPDIYTSNPKMLPSTALGLETRYDIVANGLGANGFFVKDYQQLYESFNKALLLREQGKASLLNVIINPNIGAKLQFGWQSNKVTKL